MSVYVNKKHLSREDDLPKRCIYRGVGAAPFKSMLFGDALWCLIRSLDYTVDCTVMSAQ